jgi:hypothetical protein
MMVLSQVPVSMLAQVGCVANLDPREFAAPSATAPWHP